MTVHIVVSQVMPASCERTFGLIHDYGRRLEWDTLLRRAYVEGGTADVGKIAVCNARWLLGGYSFHTRYVTFKPPHLAAIKLESKPPFFTKWAASIRHEPIDSDDTDHAADHRGTNVQARDREPAGRIGETRTAGQGALTRTTRP